MKQNKDEKIFNLLMQQGFLIGSRAYGGFKDSSDYDLVIDDVIYQKIVKACSVNNIKLNVEHLWGFSENMDKHNMFNVINEYINFSSGKKLNILGYKKEDLPLIKDVHEAMQALCDTVIGVQMMKNKQFRIEIFQSLKNVAFNKQIKKQCKCVGLSHQWDCPEYEIPF